MPCRLGDIHEDVCYLGLVYKKLNEDPANRSACCAAQMFIDSGDGMVFRGNIGDWYNPDTQKFHISKNDAVEMINQSLEAFKEKLGKGKYPKEIFIHAKTLFSDEEWDGLLKLLLVNLALLVFAFKTLASLNYIVVFRFARHGHGGCY